MLHYDVLCVGSATVDHFLTINQPLKSVHLGDKVLVNRQETHTGGGGTNSAVALAKLGFHVKLLSKLGNDHDADLIQKELRSHGIQNICSAKSKKATDSSVLLDSPYDKDRIIYVHKGASVDLSPDDYCHWRIKARWIYLASLVGESFAVAQDIAHLSMQKNIPLLFNPSLYIAKKGKRYLGSVLRATTILILNKEEAAALLGKKRGVHEMLRSLSGLGPETVVITDGEKQLFAWHEGSRYAFLPPPVKVQETAGAGDAFASGLLAGVLKGYSFEDALCLGQVNALSVIQHMGCKVGLLDEETAVRMMKRHKINVRREE